MAEHWIISDQHFFHENMYKFTLYDGGPRVRERFTDHHEGDQYMLDIHNDIVKPQDHIWMLGDWTLARSGADIPKLENWNKQFNGHKRLVLGNHDHYDVRVYRNIGFQKVQAIHKFDRIWLTHVPVHPMSMPGWCNCNVHGHTHASADEPSFVDAQGHVKTYLNVSVERIEYKPLNMCDILAMVKNKQEQYT
jgi:calcineurin-like phosphoesterase family protein